MSIIGIISLVFSVFSVLLLTYFFRNIFENPKLTILFIIFVGGPLIIFIISMFGLFNNPIVVNWNYKTNLILSITFGLLLFIEILCFVSYWLHMKFDWEISNIVSWNLLLTFFIGSILMITFGSTGLKNNIFSLSKAGNIWMIIIGCFLILLIFMILLSKFSILKNFINSFCSFYIKNKVIILKDNLIPLNVLEYLLQNLNKNYYDKCYSKGDFEKEINLNNFYLLGQCSPLVINYLEKLEIPYEVLSPKKLKNKKEEKK